MLCEKWSIIKTKQKQIVLPGARMAALSTAARIYFDGLYRRKQKYMGEKFISILSWGKIVDFFPLSTTIYIYYTNLFWAIDVNVVISTPAAKTELLIKMQILQTQTERNQQIVYL